MNSVTFQNSHTLSKHTVQKAKGSVPFIFMLIKKKKIMRLITNTALKSLALIFFFGKKH